MKLDFAWVARFSDGTVLKQFEDSVGQGSEVGFKAVLDKQDALEVFELVGSKAGIRVSVDLVRGTVCSHHIDDAEVVEPDMDMLRQDKYQYRLIYFRRVSRNFNSKFQEIGEPSVAYFLGFQYTDENGKNHKRLMRIGNNGQFVIN